MTLEESVRSLVGGRLQVQPVHGWGWSGSRPVASSGPAPFGMRVERFFSFRGELRGGVGQVEEPGHENDGFWVVFGTRHDGPYNFSSRIAHFTIVMSKAVPSLETEGWPIFPAAEPALEGFATIER